MSGTVLQWREEVALPDTRAGNAGGGAWGGKPNPWGRKPNPRGHGACAVHRSRRARGPREAGLDQRAIDPALQGGKRLAHARLGASGLPGWGRRGGVS